LFKLLNSDINFDKLPFQFNSCIYTVFQLNGFI